MTEETKQNKNNSTFEFAFAITKDLQGNLGIGPLQEGDVISTEQIYDACHRVCRNIETQEVAHTVAAQLMEAASAAQTKKIITPADLRRIK